MNKHLNLLLISTTFHVQTEILKRLNPNTTKLCVCCEKMKLNLKSRLKLKFNLNKVKLVKDKDLTILAHSQLIYTSLWLLIGQLKVLLLSLNHPSIHYPNSIPAVIGWEVKYTEVRPPVYHRTNMQRQTNIHNHINAYGQFRVIN